MAVARPGREYAQSHLHQVVATILLAVTRQLRLLARHEVGLADGIDPVGGQSLQPHVRQRFHIAWVQIEGEENGPLLVLAHIVDGAMVALVG